MTVQRQARLRLSISGIVQGVGFRPFVYGLATGMDLSGWVQNNNAGVTVEVQGPPDVVAAFAEALPLRAPPLARIDAVEPRSIAVRHDDGGFAIVASRSSGPATTPVSPDVATCEACATELADPTDRRFGYPFINCTNCGPRYSIVVDIPYDRPNTTMADFELCGDCGAEYEDPTDRRFHAQPVCCPRCGPQLEGSIEETVVDLRRGRIVAIKGLGGYHLAVRAADHDAVARLRSRKHREDKPFAVMVPTLDAARALCLVDDVEEALLSAPERPIVLLRRRAGAAVEVAAEVAPGASELGLMLPYTPLHRLLLDELGEAMVCTSANLSDEPIAYRDDDARLRLGRIADSFLTHNRPIHIRIDDSVTRVIDGLPYPIRRSRGYAPAPLKVLHRSPRPILACGAELKNTIAYARRDEVYVSHHIGDLKTHETYLAFVEAVEHLGRLFAIEPQVVANDLHPDYLSSAYAAERTDLDLVGVQHHHAHVAACLADAGHPGPVIGVAFDGMGYGDDGTIWGGEFLVADEASYTRAGWLEPVPMPGGDAATAEPWRMTASHLAHLGEPAPTDLGVRLRNESWSAVVEIARAGINSPMTSSAGRLFDAVAALLDVRDRINYEGQAAIELERLADPGERGAYRASVSSGDGTHVAAGSDLVAAALADLRHGLARPAIAMRFHRGVASAVAEVCRRIRSDSGIGTVALSGGVFLNRVLLIESIRRLEADGFSVLRHRRVPCNDGGISFGQAVVAAALDRRGLIGS